jgi:hypothetical protein
VAFREDHHAAAHRYEEIEVIGHRRLFFGDGAPAQLRAVPPRDQREAVPIEDRPQHRGLPRKLAAQLDSA